MSGEKWVRGVTLSLVMAALCHQGGHEVAFFVFTVTVWWKYRIALRQMWIRPT